MRCRERLAANVAPLLAVEELTLTLAEMPQRLSWCKRLIGVSRTVWLVSQPQPGAVSWAPGARPGSLPAVAADAGSRRRTGRPLRMAVIWP